MSTRRLPMPLLGSAVVLCVIRLLVGMMSWPASLQDRVHWLSVSEAQARSITSGRSVLYFFYREDDELSARLEREVFGDSELAAALSARYVLTKVSDLQELGGNSVVVQELERQLGVSEFPSLVVVGAGAKSLRSFSRYPSRSRTIQFLLGPGATNTGIGRYPRKGLGPAVLRIVCLDLGGRRWQEASASSRAV